MGNRHGVGDLLTCRKDGARHGQNQGRTLVGELSNQRFWEQWSLREIIITVELLKLSTAWNGCIKPRGKSYCPCATVVYVRVWARLGVWPWDSWQSKFFTTHRTLPHYGCLHLPLPLSWSGLIIFLSYSSFVIYLLLWHHNSFSLIIPSSSLLYITHY